MLKLKAILWMCSGLVLCAAPVHAQDCGAILRDGVWRTWEQAGDSTERSDFANWACSNRSKHLGGSYNEDKLDYDENGSDCSRNGGSFYLTKKTRESLKTEAVHIISAWKDCIHQRGSHVTLLFGADVNSFFLQFDHQQLDPERLDNRPAMATVTFRPANIVDCDLKLSVLQKGIKIVGGKALSCSRNDKHQAVNITVTLTFGGGQPLVFDAVKSTKIVYRFAKLPYETDCEGTDVSSLCTAGVKPANDEEHCNPRNVGMVAVCFNGRQGTALPGAEKECANAINSHQPWCTYKSNAKCEGGNFKAPAYKCLPQVVDAD